MYNLKNIELHFENLESASINSAHIKSLSYRVNTNKEVVNLKLELSALANKTDVLLYGEDQTVFERVEKYKDIVSIGFYYLDGKSKSLYLKWEDNEHGSDENVLQKVNRVGEFEENLEIIVSEEPNNEKEKSGKQTRENIHAEKVQKFLKEIEKVSVEYSLSLSHEDHQGSFVVMEYDENNIQRLYDAIDYSK